MARADFSHKKEVVGKIETIALKIGGGGTKYFYPY